MMTREKGAPATDGSAQETENGNQQSLIFTVIELLADELDEVPHRMQPPLGTVIDPDILDCLERSESESEQTFTFTYRGIATTVTNRGTVHLSETPVHESY